MRETKRIPLLVLSGTLLLSSCGKNFFTKPGGGGGAGGGGGTSKFLYVLNAGSGSNGTVQAFSVNSSNGTLSRIGNAVNAGTSPQAMAIHSSNRFLYVASLEGILAFSIHSEGSLFSLAGSPFSPGTGPIALATDVNGKFLYALNSLSTSISVFQIDNSSGALTARTGSPAMSGTPLNLVVAPNAGSIYVAEGTTGVAVFHVDSSGGITGGSVAAPPSGSKAQDLAVAPNGTLLYASNGGSGAAAYSISSSGDLTTQPITGSPFIQSGASGADSLTVDPTGKFVYVANNGSGNVSGFAILGGGSLTPLSSSPFAAGIRPAAVRVESGGKFVYVANTGSSPDISIYSVDSAVAGKLNSAGSASSGTNPIAIVTSH